MNQRARRFSRRVLGAAVGAVALLGGAAGQASAQLPATSGDPRIGLAAGATDAQAGKAQLGLEHLANHPKPAAVSGTNSDIAFQGDHAFVGNYNGINIYDIADPANPTLTTSIACPGSQNDVSVYGNLLFVSVEATTAKIDCSTTPAATPETRFRGIRIFDISNINAPVQVKGVQTCRGSHTHTLVRPKGDDANVYIYVSGTAGPRASTELPGCFATTEPGDAPASEQSSRFRIDVIKVPLAKPADAAVVGGPRLFENPQTGADDGLQNAPQTPQHPSSTGWSPSPITDACHDITVYEALDLAAGACEGNGLLIDISDPAHPKRIDAVADPLFAYWHGATFSNDGKTVVFTDEWGGGSGARCRATDQLSWGANAIYEIVDKKLIFRSYYKLPVAQATTENCVSHVGNLIPVPGRDILVQAWYQGGISVLDFTNPSQPKEIGYFDRGPVNATALATGGFWSAYWYNGRVYGSEIARGFDTFKLAATDSLSAQEIAAAERRTELPRLNAQSQEPFTWDGPPAQGDVGGSVPATLSLTLGAPAAFEPFTPGVAKTYEASTSANVISTAGDATLSVADPGHLVNGAFWLPQPLQVALSKSTWLAPVSNDPVTVTFKQDIGANDALRTGTYSKTVTFTLSTTNP